MSGKDNQTCQAISCPCLTLIGCKARLNFIQRQHIIQLFRAAALSSASKLAVSPVTQKIGMDAVTHEVPRPESRHIIEGLVKNGISQGQGWNPVVGC